VLRVELYKLIVRPRTWLIITVLTGLPVLVGILLKVTGVAPRPGTGPPLLSEVLTNGTLFPVAALGLVLPLFLPVAVAMVGGESIAGEAAGGTLRYLLIRPVSRSYLLVSKLITVSIFVVLAVLVVAGVGFIVGATLFGVHPLSTVSGQAVPTQDATLRIFVAVLFAMVSMLGVAAIALFASVLTDSPVGAGLAAIAVLVCSEVLDLLDAAAVLKPYLPTHYWLSFVDIFRFPILWHNVTRGFLIQGVYILVFLGAAWARFSTKDITS
jgi:ABC-2 type transport system permease protein